MKRNCSLEEISDGNLYDIDDLVEVSCNGCKGRASCCHGMGTSIILDPYDIYRLTTNFNMTFEQLLRDKIELNIVDGIILPNLKMSGSSDGCVYLNDRGKCSIHGVRPGICRIFPLGRYYTNHSFQYILQIHECKNHTKTKVKISKWIDTPDNERNKQFIINWHYFLIEVENKIKKIPEDNMIKNINMYLLNHFYVMKYDSDKDFYLQFDERISKAQSVLFQTVN